MSTKLPIHTIRHRNLRLLMHKLGGQKALIEATGKSQGQISQLVKLADYKKMGEKLARDIEQKCDLPTGWLDTDTTAQKINEAPTPTYTATPHQPGDNYQTISTALRRVPVISPAMAGRWRDIVENFDPGTASDWTETTLDLGAHGFALRMVGDSMYSQHHDKSIPDGATMYVKADLEPETGDIVVAQTTERTRGHRQATCHRRRPTLPQTPKPRVQNSRRNRRVRNHRCRRRVE